MAHQHLTFAGLPSLRISQKQTPHWKTHCDGHLDMDVHTHPKAGWASFDVTESYTTDRGQEVKQRVMFTLGREDKQALIELLSKEDEQ